MFDYFWLWSQPLRRSKRVFDRTRNIDLLLVLLPVWSRADISAWIHQELLQEQNGKILIEAGFSVIGITGTAEGCTHETAGTEHVASKPGI